MPTYKNKNGSGKVIGGQGINAGEIKKILSYPTTKLEGIEMIDEAPMYNPTILSERITESKTVRIPESESRFAIHFCAIKGEPVVYYNSKENKPPLNLYEGARWNERVYERVVDKLIIEIPEGGILWIIVERM
jgi:hypothetical protein